MPCKHPIARLFPHSSLKVIGTLMVVALLTSGCDSETELTRQSLIQLQVGEALLDAQFAIDAATQQKGLMHRESLPQNQGMLFISERPRSQSFWMRNTHIPLDIGFFTADGVLREVYPLFPRVEEPVKSRRDDILYALEMNRGWFKANGVQVGDQLDLERVNDALRALGTAR